MTIRFVGAIALASGIFAASAAESDFSRNFNDQATAAGCSSDGSGCVTLIVNRFQGFDGVLQGSVLILASTPNSSPFFWRMQCSGPAFADVLFLNSATGATNISATLDPLTPGCTSTNVSEPVILNVDGHYDGNTRSTQDGKFYSDTRGAITRTNFRIDRFSAAFSGTVRHSAVVLGGSLSAERNQRVDQEIVPQSPR